MEFVAHAQDCFAVEHGIARFKELGARTRVLESGMYALSDSILLYTPDEWPTTRYDRRKYLHLVSKNDVVNGYFLIPAYGMSAGQKLALRPFGPDRTRDRQQVALQLFYRRELPRAVRKQLQCAA